MTAYLLVLLNVRLVVQWCRISRALMRVQILLK